MILVGLPGAGKTTFYRERFAATHRHVSKDLMPRYTKLDELAADKKFILVYPEAEGRSWGLLPEKVKTDLAFPRSVSFAGYEPNAAFSAGAR